MKEVQVQHAPSSFTRLENESALMITRSLHCDLDLDAVVTRMYTYLDALTSITGLAYNITDPNFDAEFGEMGEHKLTYELKLTSQEQTAGTVILSSTEPFSKQDQQLIEELLSLAANALRNAHLFMTVTPTSTSQDANKDKKYSDALVLARIDGLDTIRDAENTQFAQRIMRELKNRLGNSLREADGTMAVDEDHIAILLPCTATIGAQRVAQKIATLVDGLEFVDPILRSELSVSIGISSTKDASSAAAVLASAKGQLAKPESRESNVIH